MRDFINLILEAIGINPLIRLIQADDTPLSSTSRRGMKLASDPEMMKKINKEVERQRKKSPYGEIVINTDKL